MQTGTAKADLQSLPGGAARLVVSGRLSVENVAALWSNVLAPLRRDPPRRLVIDATGVDYCDGSGAGLLVDAQRVVLDAGGEASVEGARPDVQQLLSYFPPATFQSAGVENPAPVRAPEHVGRVVVQQLQEFCTLIAFMGEMSVALFRAALAPRQVRWREVWIVAETAGINGLPIVVLIGFLMGLIMAFQSAMPLRQFGADIFVANLVALAMLRELGPLMTAVVLAGRSGSAFAAEIGTMKVNEEVNALTTMGLDPLRFLAVPRVVAAVLMMPLLTLFANLAGLVGGALVLLSLGYPLITFIRQVQFAVVPMDLIGGLLKAFVFGILVAGIGCYRGLQTKTGPTAVGSSTTSAVVSGIVLIAIADGCFTILFYTLGI